ncbi:MAG: hypothetical protein HJHJAOHD_02559 [Flavobacteriales bacterium]|nr:hypothetical protein [Flavobacteriales bacterium]
MSEKTEKPDFTQKNVDKKIKEIKSLSDCEREDIANQIKADLRAWLLMTFQFTRVQEICMTKWPLSMREETGFGIGTALLYKEWNLEIIFPKQPEPPTPVLKKKHEQTVKGEYNTSTGGYTVTKSHTWSW